MGQGGSDHGAVVRQAVAVSVVLLPARRSRILVPLRAAVVLPLLLDEV